jgi:DNA gyrase subunit A
VVLATAGGQIKRLLVSSLRPCQRGDMGQIGLRLQQREDALIDLQAAESAVISLLTGKGWSGRLDLSHVPGEDSSGSGISVSLPAGQFLQELVPLIS